MDEMKVPMTDEINAMSDDEREAFVLAYTAELEKWRNRPLCPISGMGRDLIEWDRCRPGMCEWYLDYSDTSGGCGCAIPFIVQAMPE